MAEDQRCDGEQNQKENVGEMLRGEWGADVKEDF